MYAWLIGSLVVVFLVAGAGYKGWEAGGDHVRAEYAAERVQAQKEADAYATGLRTSARRQAQNLQKTLAVQKGLNRDLGTVIEAHIRAIPAPPAGCPAPALSDELRNDLNRALAGPSDTSR